MPHMPSAVIPTLLRLYLFGAFEIEELISDSDGNAAGTTPINLPTRKIESLIAYLALHPEVHSREKLAALFWGDFTDRKARDSLRNALAVLRKYLDIDLLITTRDSIRFNPACTLWIDALEFNKIAEVSPESALALYRGELLANFYDDWIMIEREEYRARYIKLALELTRQMRARSEYTGAIEFARKILINDPSNERAHQNLMFCYAAIGNRAAALQQYEDCARLLQAELDVPPAPETTALWQWIRQNPAREISTEALSTNVPIPITSFIGREQEMTQVKQLLALNRLVTVTGAGGSGKTRLAIQVASDVLDSYKDGVWWVDLASLMDDVLVPQAVAKALGIQETAQTLLTETLVNYLHSKQLLLVIDNCEHLIGACARLIETLLSACRNLKVLATSREALGITGEQAWQAPTLALPTPRTTSITEMLMEYEGIRLFVERAVAVKPDFSLTDQNASSVMEICQRLDGIPLALELAAARMSVLSIQEIAVRLSDRFNLLNAGSRTALPRQQTLRALIDWSYDLLSDNESIFFCRLSIFTGGFTLNAAEQVCSDEKLDQGEILNLISNLVRKSLVMVEIRDGEGYYRLLETIREYAQEKLSETGEMARLRMRHLDFFLRLAEEVKPHLTSANRSVWLERLDASHDNLRAALEWSQNPLVGSELGLRFTGALYWFWYHQGYLSEGRDWLESALVRAESSAPTEISNMELAHQAKALYALARLTHALGNNFTAKPLLEKSLSLWREIVPLDKQGLADTLVALGWLWRDEGLSATARAQTEEAVALFREQGSQAGLANALVYLGMAARDQEEYDLARSSMEEGAAIYRKLGDEWGIANALHHLGLIAYRQGDYEAGYQQFEETLDIRRKLDNKAEIPYTLHNLGLVTLCQGDAARAKQFFAEGEILFRELGDKNGMAISLVYDGHLAILQDHVGLAESFYSQALTFVRAGIGPTWARGECLLGLAGVAAVKGQSERAARLWGAAESQMMAGSSFWDAADRRLYERTVAQANAQLSSTAFEASRKEGQLMTLHQAILYALRAEDE